MANLIDSYTATRLGLTGRINEALALYRSHAVDTRLTVATYLREMDEIRASIEAALGQPLIGKTILEIGPGAAIAAGTLFRSDQSCDGH